MEDPVPLEAEGGQGGLGRSDIVIRGSQAVWGSPEDSGEESVGSRRLPESSGRFRRRARRLGEVPCVNTYRAPTAERRACVVPVFCVCIFVYVQNCPPLGILYIYLLLPLYRIAELRGGLSVIFRDPFFTRAFFNS